ncbi:MAG: hypothetical protein ABH808_02060 [Candidatus Kuenenbacteria bacterium]
MEQLKKMEEEGTHLKRETEEQDVPLQLLKNIENIEKVMANDKIEQASKDEIYKAFLDQMKNLIKRLMKEKAFKKALS